jgi:hypothetical protein
MFGYPVYQYIFVLLVCLKTPTGLVAAAIIFLHVRRVTEKGKPGESRAHKPTGLRVVT